MQNPLTHITVLLSASLLLIWSWNTPTAHAAYIPQVIEPAKFISRRAGESAGQLPNGATLHFLHECPIVASSNITCADLIVPERRDIPDSRMITVRVALIPGPEAQNADPFVFLMGGKGQGFSVLDKISQLPPLVQREVITLEQCGTELADPNFSCPDIQSGVTGVDQILTPSTIQS